MLPIKAAALVARLADPSIVAPNRPQQAARLVHSRRDAIG